MRVSNSSIEVSKSPEVRALKAHIQTLKEQLAGTQAELAVLRPEASEAVALKATRAALDAEMAVVRADLEYWRQLAQTLAEKRRTAWLPWRR